MALFNDLQNTVLSIFRNYTNSTVAVPSNKGNLYELYLYLLIYKTIKRINGGNVRIVNPSPNNSFVFRCSPGLIRNNQYSYVIFDKGNSVFELRNGTELIGINTYHEMDITIFRNNQLDNSRPNKNNGEIVWAIECKNHAKLSSLKGEIRKFLGAITDLTINSHAMAGCIHCGIGFTPLFATPLNSPINHQYRVFLNNYGLNPFFNLKPNTNEENDFVLKVDNLYRNEL